MKYRPIKVRVTGQVYRHEFEAVVGNTSGIKKTKCRGFYVEKASLRLDEDAPESRLGTVDIDNEKIVKKEVEGTHVLVYSPFDTLPLKEEFALMKGNGKLALEGDAYIGKGAYNWIEVSKVEKNSE